MHRTALAAVALLLAAPVVGAGAPASPAPRVQGKMRAPITVDASVTERSARVTVRFDRPGRNVRVRVSGLDGLVVTSAPSAYEAARVRRGEVATFDVAFTPGAGRSLLTVAVTGQFGGRRATTTSFPVGERSAEQRTGPGTVMEDPGGGRVKVLRSGR